jgi:hypothetical protein
MIRQCGKAIGLILVGLVWMGGIQSARGALIVYEGFATGQGGYNLGSLIGQNPNASTVGLVTSSPWATAGSSSGGGQDVVSTSLSIGSGATALQTTGGALLVTKGASGDRRTGATFNVSAFTGALYHSYLVNLGDSGGGTLFTTAGDGIGTAGRRFRASPRSSGTGNPVAADYIGNTDNAGTGAIATGTTYIMLARYTRVGETIDALNPGVATVFALTSAQFDNFKAAGFAGIDSAAVGAGATDITGKATSSDTSGTNTFPGTGSPALGFQFIAGTNTTNVTVDEFRYGMSFDDVTPVPEPQSLGLAIFGLASWVLLRRRGIK